MRRLRTALGVLLRGLVLLLVALPLLACGLHVANTDTDTLPVRPEGTLRVATYNVHYISLRAEDGPWSVPDWERRKAPLAAAVAAVEADVIAFQEMESFGRGDRDGTNLTLDYLLASDPRYAAAAVGDPAEFPSTQPIFYRTDRLDLVEEGWFFFSDTPDVIYSRTFNGSWPALASWARFAPVGGGAPVTVVNVHFEYRSGSNRLLSAALVRDRMGPRIATGEPVILLGDLNALRGSKTMGVLEEAGWRFAPVNGSTYHFDRGVNLFGAIDHIGVTEGVEVEGDPVILQRRFMGEWPTDHYPVMADLRMP